MLANSYVCPRRGVGLHDHVNVTFFIILSVNELPEILLPKVFKNCVKPQTAFRVLRIVTLIQASLRHRLLLGARVVRTDEGQQRRRHVPSLFGACPVINNHTESITTVHQSLIVSVI